MPEKPPTLRGSMVPNPEEGPDSRLKGSLLGSNESLEPGKEHEGIEIGAVWRNRDFGQSFEITAVSGAHGERKVNFKSLDSPAKIVLGVERLIDGEKRGLWQLQKT